MKKKKSKSPAPKKNVSPENHLNCEIVSADNLTLSQVRRAQAETGVIRTSDQERVIENRLLDQSWNDDNMHFRGVLDGITHYMIWALVFVMPIFIPYFRELNPYYYSAKSTSSGIGETPSLLKSALVYMALLPLVCWLITWISRTFQKKKIPTAERIGLGAIVTLLSVGIYFILCDMELLPKALYYADTGQQNEGRVSVWFSSFSNGKFFLTYITTILATLFFVIQQRMNRDHLVFRFPLKKIITAFFVVHIVSLAYPIMHPTESMLHESLMRLHQWIQYFLIFLIIVNSMTSLGRIYSIAKASSVSGTIVALVGVAQYFTTTVGMRLLKGGDEPVQITKSFVFFNAAEHQPFGTFGHNNFAAAYVCLATPLTIALLAGLFVRRFDDKHRNETPLTFILFLFMLAIQFTYLVISVGKAGIVSMVVAIAASLLFVPFMFKIELRQQAFGLLKKAGVAFAVILLLFGGGLLAAKAHPASAVKTEALLNKWRLKFQSPFDMKQGANRVRLSYAGGAMQLSRSNPADPKLKFSPLHMLTGVGANNYKYHYPRVRDLEEANIEKGKHVLQSHCDFAQAASDTGVIGFFIFGLLIVYPVLAGGRILMDEDNLQRKMLGLGFLCTLIAMGVNALFFFPFQTPGSLLPYFVSLGLLFSYERSSKEIPLVNRLSFAGIALVGLVFYSYEAWYTTRHDPSGPMGRLIENVFIVSGVLALIYIVHSFLSQKSKNWNDIIVIRPTNIALIIVFVGYVWFSKAYSLSYLYTDYMKQAHLTAPFGRLQAMSEGMQKKPKNYAPRLKAYNGDWLLKTMATIRKYCADSIAINPNNPDIYQMRATALHHYSYLIQSHLNGRLPGEPSSVIDLRHQRIQDLKRAGECWPMNRDIHNQLTQDHINLAQSNPVGQRNNYEEALKHSKISMQIFANEPSSLHSLFISATKLNKWPEFMTFYNDHLKDNPFLSYEINTMLAQYFERQNPSEFEAVLKHDFMSYPYSAQSIGRLDTLLKSKGQAQGVISLLNEKRWDGRTLYEFLTNETHHHLRVDAYREIIKLMIDAGEGARAVAIQDFYLNIQSRRMNLVEESSRRSKMNGDSLEARIPALCAEKGRFFNRLLDSTVDESIWFAINALKKSARTQDLKAARTILSNYMGNASGRMIKNIKTFRSGWESLDPPNSFEEEIRRLHKFNGFNPSSKADRILLNDYLSDLGLVIS